MKSFLFIVIIFVFSAGFIFSQDKKETNESVIHIEKFDPSRDAAKDVENAIKEATNTNRRIILDVGGEWCIWCHRLDTLFIKNPDLYKYLNGHYVYVKVNMSLENRNKELLSKYPPIPGYPHWFVLDSDGKLLKSESSAEFEEGGRHSARKVMAFLKEWTLKD